MRAAEYTCARCGGTFGKGWTDDQADAEYAELFPDEHEQGADRAVVCDDCFRKMCTHFGIVPPEQPIPLCPVCGKPAPARAWCSQECEDFDEKGVRP